MARGGRRAILAAIGLAAAVPAGAADLVSIDLARPFATRSPWRLTVSQAPDGPDPIFAGERAPGALTVCISDDGGRSCRPDLRHALTLTGGDDPYAEPHYLDRAEIVQPRPGRALLLLRLASLHGGNNNQRVATQLLAYNWADDRFVTVYAHQTGRNNNEEVRYVATGRLRGAVIAAEPTEGAPFRYWITVSRLTAAPAYRQVLRYRSATRAILDSNDVITCASLLGV